MNLCAIIRDEFARISQEVVGSKHQVNAVYYSLLRSRVLERTNCTASQWRNAFSSLKTNGFLTQDGSIVRLNRANDRRQSA